MYTFILEIINLGNINIYSYHKALLLNLKVKNQIQLNEFIKIKTILSLYYVLHFFPNFNKPVTLYLSTVCQEILLFIMHLDEKNFKLDSNKIL